MPCVTRKSQNRWAATRVSTVPIFRMGGTSERMNWEKRVCKWARADDKANRLWLMNLAE